MAILIGILGGAEALAQDASGPMPPPDPAVSQADAARVIDVPGDCSERYLVLLVDASLDEAFAREIAVDLAVELQPRSIGVCKVARTDIPPVALVTLHQNESVLSVELDDRVTHKRVQRDLSLLKVPVAGRALAAAIAVDELLRASWAELTMGGPREPADVPAPEPPPDAGLPSEPALAPRARARARRGALSAWIGYQRGPESWNALLAGANLSAWPQPWLWLQLGLFGLRTGTVDASLGNLHGRGLVADATVGACPWNARRGFTCAGLRGGIDWVSFAADAKAGLAEARNQSSTGAHLAGVLSLGLALGRYFLLTTELALGGPLQQVVATDGNERLLGTRGPMWNLGLGLGVAR